MRRISASSVRGSESRGENALPSEGRLTIQIFQHCPIPSLPRCVGLVAHRWEMNRDS